MSPAAALAPATVAATGADRTRRRLSAALTTSGAEEARPLRAWYRRKLRPRTGARPRGGRPARRVRPFCGVVRSPRDERERARRGVGRAPARRGRRACISFTSRRRLPVYRRSGGRQASGSRRSAGAGSWTSTATASITWGTRTPQLVARPEGPARRPHVLAPPVHQRRRRRPRAPARGSGAGAPRQGPAGAVRQRRDGDRAPARARGDGALQDGLVLGRLPRGGARGVERGRRAGVPLGPERSAAARRRSTSPRRPATGAPTAIPSGTDGRSSRCAGSRAPRFVRYVLEKEGDVAAVVAEPIRSTAYVPPPGFWAEVRAACDAHGALLVF